jgi:hypothetical protein
MAYVVEHIPSKCKALSSNSSTRKKGKEEGRKEGRKEKKNPSCCISLKDRCVCVSGPFSGKISSESNQYKRVDAYKNKNEC